MLDKTKLSVRNGKLKAWYSWLRTAAVNIRVGLLHQLSAKSHISQ